MMDIPKLRLLNQQLANPLFHSPKELVSWMGAVQAQDYAMAKWAVGMRLASATVRTVEEALQKGEASSILWFGCYSLADNQSSCNTSI